MFKAYSEKIQQLKENAPKTLEKLVKRGAIHYRNTAVKLTDANKAVDTGYYKRNWEGAAVQTDKETYQIVGYNGVEYASFLEDGYSIKKQHFVPFPDSDEKKEQSKPLELSGKVLHREKGSKGARTGSAKLNKFINEFRSKYPDAKGFMAKPRRYQGKKIGRQAMKDLRAWIKNEIERAVKHLLMKGK